MSIEAKVTRPVLRYHGGKWLLAPWLIEHFPEHQVYVELFGGAASVLLRKPRSKSEVYCEIDPDVVNLFQVLRDPGNCAELCRQLELTPFSREDFQVAYEEYDWDHNIERARKLVVRSFFGFGSSGNRAYITGFRASSKQSNRAHAMDWANVPEALHAVVERLKGVTIENRSAFQVIKQQDSAETLFYADPPYPHFTRSSHCKNQYAFEMDTNDHRQLALVLNQIKGKAIVSGYPNELYEEFYRGWRRVEREHSKAGQVGRVPSTEVLWMNF